MLNIVEKPTDTAAEFWDLLSPQNTLFEHKRRVLYRGQASAMWSLTPAAFRSLEEQKRPPGENDCFEEWRNLKNFVYHCDSIGLPIPHDSPLFRQRYIDIEGRGGLAPMVMSSGLWPLPDYYPLLALAQHYGVPTRLLDWSERSFVAAYFAISQALRDLKAKSLSCSDRLAVWALNTEDELHPHSPLAVFRVPVGNNANLAAQSGWFTLLRHSEGNRQTSVEQYFQDCRLLTPSELIKVTLPISEAVKALELCNLYGITGATLFPSYYGAARGALDSDLKSYFGP